MLAPGRWRSRGPDVPSFEPRGQTAGVEVAAWWQWICQGFRGAVEVLLCLLVGVGGEKHQVEVGTEVGHARQDLAEQGIVGPAVLQGKGPIRKAGTAICHRRWSVRQVVYWEDLGAVAAGMVEAAQRDSSLCRCRRRSAGTPTRIGPWQQQRCCKRRSRRRARY